MSRIAARQERLISQSQLYALGMTRAAIRSRVQREVLHPKHRGVYIVGPPTLSPKGHLLAGLLTLGPKSFLSHRASVAYQGLRPINIRELEFTVVASSTPRRPGLIVHRVSEPPHRSEVVHRFGLRYSSFARAVVELAARETAEELMRLITESVRRGIANFDALRATLARHQGRPGVPLLADLAFRYLDTTDRKSNLERSFDAHAATDPRIPPYEKNVRHGPYELDVFFPDRRVALELDGRPYHSALQDTERDHAKDVWLQLQRIRPIRITDFRWEYDRAGAINDLLGLLALAN